MTTTDDDNQEPDMTAATVEQDQHTEPHVYPENPQATTPAVTRQPDPAQDLEPTEEFKARIRAMMSAVPAPDVDEPVYVSRDEHRLAINRLAWENSLKAAHSDALSITLDALGDDQHARRLGMFVKQIGEPDSLLNLVVAGRVATGKSSAAIACGNAAVERGLMARIVKHSQYLTWLRPEGCPNDLQDWQIRKRFRDCHLLILDDLGAELDGDREASRFVREETLGLIGDRIDSGRATIVTTNETPARLTLMLGERLMSRLSKRGDAIKFTGPDRRGHITW